MDSTHIFGVAAGGVLIAILGGVAEYMREKEFPNYKSIVRDFLIGSIMVVFLLQIVPESMVSLFAYMPSMKALVDSVPSVGGGDSGPDLQLGPARF